MAALVAASAKGTPRQLRPKHQAVEAGEAAVVAAYPKPLADAWVLASHLWEGSLTNCLKQQC